MADELMRLELTDHAQKQYSTLGLEDQRQLDAWFGHLRNWRTDEKLRSLAWPLGSYPENYAMAAGPDFIVAFRIAGDRVIVLSIFSKETVRAFVSSAEQNAP